MGREGSVVQISHNRFLRDARTAEGLGKTPEDIATYQL